MKKSLKILSFLLAAMILLSFSACGAQKGEEKEPETGETLVLESTAIEHEEKFGGVDIKTADYAHYAKVYLASIGLTDAEITALENRFVAK